MLNHDLAEFHSELRGVKPYKEIAPIMQLARVVQMPKILVDTEGEVSKQLFQILEEWDFILQGASVDLSPSL